MNVLKNVVSKIVNILRIVGWKIQKYYLSLISMIRTNIRDYGMYIALFVIFIIFSILTGFVFLQPYNFTKLLNQSAYVAVLAVGMTLVIVTRQIDLSVGYIGAFLGAYVVVAVENLGQPVWLAIAGALAITIVVGAAKGLLIAKIKVPAFVVTLAGMFIFKGLLFQKTSNSFIPTTNNFFAQVGSGYLPTYTLAGTEMDLITLLIGLIALVSLLVGGIRSRIKNNELSIPNEKIELFVTKMVFMLGIIGYLMITFASYRGISYLLLITVVVVVFYHFMTTKTTLGRRIYAVGGNPEAAELSGISVEKTLVIVFISMGVLAMIAGIMYSARLQNTSPNHGPFWELYAIAAAFIGGTSAAGGVGKVVNAVIGAVVIVALRNGMSLSGIDSNVEPVILGGVLLLAVIFDIFTRNVKPIDYVGIHYAKQKFREELSIARVEFNTAKLNLKEAEKAQVEDLIEYEYKFTSAQGAYNKIKDKIRTAKEEDYVQ